MKEKHLRETFEKIGELEGVEIVRDPFSGESRGFGFVTYGSKHDAERAVDTLDKSDLHGRVIAVQLAKRKRARGPTPGKYLGKYKSRRSRSRSDSYRRSRYDDRDRRDRHRRDDPRDYKYHRERSSRRDRYRDSRSPRRRRRSSRSMS